MPALLLEWSTVIGKGIARAGEFEFGDTEELTPLSQRRRMKNNTRENKAVFHTLRPLTKIMLAQKVTAGNWSVAHES